MEGRSTSYLIVKHDAPAFPGFPFCVSLNFQKCPKFKKVTTLSHSTDFPCDIVYDQTTFPPIRYLGAEGLKGICFLFLHFLRFRCRSTFLFELWLYSIT